MRVSCWMGLDTYMTGQASPIMPLLLDVRPEGYVLQHPAMPFVPPSAPPSSGWAAGQWGGVMLQREWVRDC